MERLCASSLRETRMPALKIVGSARVGLASSTREGEMAKPKVIVISGPTGVGKTRLALQLAKTLGGEIIGADSVQVYKGLDIGSAKTPIEDRQGIQHHLIDILHPTEEYSVGRYFEDSRKATRDILDRGHVPIVVGGSGLYLRWYIYGKPDVPAASPTISSIVNSKLDTFMKNGDWDAAVQLAVREGDPNAYNLGQNDWYRLHRSLEIIKAAGVPRSAFPLPYEELKGEMSAMVASSPQTRIVDKAKSSSINLDFDFLCIFLSLKRTRLYEKIDQRCEEMLKEHNGLFAEASRLLDMGIPPNSNSASRAIGYQQATEFLFNCRKEAGVCSEDEFCEFLSRFQTSSRNYAKRQIIWFRNEPLYHWLDASKPLDLLVESVVDAYRNSVDAFKDESILSNKDIDDREYQDLKRYKTQNRYFISSAAVVPLLQWIRSTQRM